MDLIILVLLLSTATVSGFRVLEPGQTTPSDAYFRPYDQGFVGVFGDPSNLQRERVNEGAFETTSQDLFYEGTNPRQACPGMVGPFTDGNFYCTAREFGYCDKRSGACFCNTGYAGLDCSECHGSHFKVGTLCVPKTLCPDDCSGAGSCNFLTGTCTCQEHRTGANCGTMLCSTFSELCETCTPEGCLRCRGGYYLTEDAEVCGTCYDFDPRCAGCTKEEGCTVCADPLLTSVRRSGYRASDPRLPVEEDTRELSVSLPFGTKSVESFAEAEHYLVVDRYSSENPLGANAQKCYQGRNNDEFWECEDIEASHIVCGHFGVFKFGYPNYVVNENAGDLRLSVSRSGGGYGNVSVSYFIKHFTTNDSDVSATAIYTTSQTLVFDEGVVERSFLINIQDDNLIEDDEVFQVVLEVPDGGGSVGPQFRTNVTIIDDDAEIFASSLSYPIANNTYVSANSEFYLTLQATDAKNLDMVLGGEDILVLVENNMETWSQRTMRHSQRRQGSIVDNGDGTYKLYGSGIKEQGVYQMRAWHAFQGGLRGQYYYDGFFDKLALERFDKKVNFTWGYGKIAPHSIDYVTIRWSGCLKTSSGGDYQFKVEADDHARLWLDGELVLDHWHEMYAKLEPSRTVTLTADKLYEIVLEYRDVRGEAHCRFIWAADGGNWEVVPPDNLYALYELNRLSPTELVIHSGDTASDKTECVGEGLFHAMAGAQSTFHVCPRDAYYNFRDDDDEEYLASELFSATLILEDDLGYDGVGAATITPTLTYDHDIHCFVGEYTPLIAGSYHLNVHFQSSVDASTEHVAGSPFTVAVEPNEAYGPYSVIEGITTPVQTAEAGSCFNFTIIARDANENKVNASAADFSAYTYQVDFLRDTAEFLGNFSHFNTTSDFVRYGTTYDGGNGTYEVELCPVLQGTHEIHVLLGGRGVSNQPYRIMDPANSVMYSSAMGTHLGQFVHDSPYYLTVTHAAASGFTSTAQGDGLVGATVMVPAYVMITVRDSWSNVLRTTSYAPAVTAMLDRSPSANVFVHNFNNGSYMIEYIAQKSGDNLLSLQVDGKHIKNSPFTVPISEAVRADNNYSVAVGAGLTTGTVGEPSMFQIFAYDLHNNRRTTAGDTFKYVLHGANNLTGYLLPCPKPPSSVSGEDSHAVCDDYDLELGHYYGVFYPEYTGISVLSIYLYNTSELINGEDVIVEHVTGSPFLPTIQPGVADPSTIDIFGDIYDTVAGYTHTMYLDLRDAYGNILTSGGYAMELVLYGVASEWGTILPWGTTPGLPNEYHYTGFYTPGALNFYGDWVDHGNGSLMVTHNATISGVYVSRYSIALPGLNATYFNTTHTFGYLSDDNFNPIDGSRYEDTHGSRAVNLANQISWTGDIGGRPHEGNGNYSGGRGGLGLGSYYHMFKSRTEDNVDFDLTEAVGSREIGFDQETKSAFTREEKFREAYWSARWTGLITPVYREEYRFSVEVDPYSTVRLLIGGRGTAINSSLGDSTQAQVLYVGNTLSNSTEIKSISGTYNFTDTLSREIVLEYVHESGDSYMTLMWESPSTKVETVPSSAFSHWVNITHTNTTVHPAEISPIDSTAYGDSLHEGVAGTLHSFTLYARDQYGNLRQVGGEVPSMVAVGSQGAQFRGNVTDYGNSTYLVEYYAPVAGDYRMYVTVGCCPAHPNVGLAAELREFRDLGLLIKGSPFELHISANKVSPLRTTAFGEGVLGGIAGSPTSFDVLFRDLHGNPTTLGEDFTAGAYIRAEFTDIATGRIFDDSSTEESISYGTLLASSSKSVVTYNFSRAGEYKMSVYYGSEAHDNGTYMTHTESEIFGSPFRVRVIPGAADASKTLCRGLGLRQAAENKSASFEIQLFDAYANKLITGGDKIYVRLNGDRSFRKDETVVPKCYDNLNGRYKCSYVARHNGYHELDVRILHASTSQPGGLGLLGNYFNSPQALINIDGDDAMAPNTYTRVDEKVSFSWPTGIILPMHITLSESEESHVTGTVANGYGSLTVGMDASLEATVRRSGQSVIWTGFVSPPRSDTFQLKLRSVGMSGSIYIDDVLVFDSLEGICESIEFLGQAAYAIVVKASVIQAASQSPVSIELMWKTRVVKWTVIPSFFLFDSAEAVYISPFPVIVGGNWTTVNLPSSIPTSLPSSQPSGQPSSMPSAQPSSNPSSEPSVQPTAQPSAEPSSQPSAEPTASPA